MGDDDMLDDLPDETAVTLGELIASSLRESSPANHVPGMDRVYEMDFQLGGSPDAGFSKAFDQVLRDPGFRASLGMSRGSISVTGGKLHLNGVTLNDAERIAPAVEAALSRANEVRKADIAEEGMNLERKAAEDKQESQKRAAFLERMTRRHQS